MIINWYKKAVSLNVIDYGFWISPQGEVYEVDQYEHENFIRDHFNLSMYKAIETGWIRIVAQDNIMVEGNSIETLRPYAANFIGLFNKMKQNNPYAVFTYSSNGKHSSAMDAAGIRDMFSIS